MARADAHLVDRADLHEVPVAVRAEGPAATPLPIKFAKRASKNPSKSAKSVIVSSVTEVEIDPTMVARILTDPTTTIALTTMIAVGIEAAIAEETTVAATIAAASTETAIAAATEAETTEAVDTAAIVMTAHEATDLTVTDRRVTVEALIGAEIDPTTETIAVEIDLDTATETEIGAVTEGEITEADTAEIATIEAATTAVATDLMEIDRRATEADSTVEETDRTVIDRRVIEAALIEAETARTTEIIAVGIDPMAEIEVAITAEVSTETIAAETDLMAVVEAATDLTATDRNDRIDRTAIVADSIEAEIDRKAIDPATATEIIVAATKAIAPAEKADSIAKVDTTATVETDLRTIEASVRKVRIGPNGTAESERIARRNRFAHRSPMPRQPRRTKTATDSTCESQSLDFALAEPRSSSSPKAEFRSTERLSSNLAPR